MNGPDVVSMQRLIAAVDLEHIRLVEVVGKASISSPQDLGAEAQLKIDGRTDARRDPNAVVVLATLETKLLSQSDPSETKLFVTCVYELRYRVPAELEASNQVLSEFARTNGLYNAWPYCRELVQNTVMRMGLPSLLMPLLKFKRSEMPENQGEVQG